MTLKGQGPVQPGSTLLIAGCQLADPGGDLLEFIPGRFIFFPGKEAGDRTDGFGMAPGHPQGQDQAQHDKNRKDRQIAENLPGNGRTDIRVPEHSGIGQPPVPAGKGDLCPVLVFPSEQAGGCFLGRKYLIPGNRKIFGRGKQGVTLINIGVDMSFNFIREQGLIHTVLNQEKQDTFSGTGVCAQRHQESDNPGTVHQGGGNLLGREDRQPVGIHDLLREAFHGDEFITHHPGEKRKIHGGG